MKLEINDPSAVLLVNRLQKEIGELFVANMFLDEHCNLFTQQLVQKDNEILVLKDKITAMDNLIQEQRNTINNLNVKYGVVENEPKE